jgi:hypothetical protein
VVERGCLNEAREPKPQGTLSQKDILKLENFAFIKATNYYIFNETSDD